MCGIVACSGTGNVSEACVSGLTRLQYRGYDSYGFAYCHDARIDRLRSLDSLDDMVPRLPDANAVIGHTRWATHGGVTLENCHPHLAADGGFALVHNGIVENYQQLRRQLVECGRSFASETDTEVVVGLLESLLRSGYDRKDALGSVLRQLEGRNTIVVLFPDGEIFGVRQGSPLMLGNAGDRLFLASDVLSFSPWTSTCFPVPEECVVRLWKDECEGFDVAGQAIDMAWATVEIDHDETGRDGHRHYMIKEIMEQWRTIPAQGIVTNAELDTLVDAIRSAGTVLVTGAGGAYYAARQIAWMLREVSHIRAHDVQAYEMDTMEHCVKPGDLLIAISQSGETADTIEAARTAGRWGLRVASLVNMPLSTLTRLSELAFHNRSGPEICVLSTKSASAQIAFGYLLAHAVAGQTSGARADIDLLSRELSHYLTDDRACAIRDVAAHIAGHDHVFVLGKDGYYGSALMGALNIKEASYIHAEAFTAGELKHGVIALIDEGVPVILFVPASSRYMINVAAEVKSRGAFVIALGDGNNELFDAFIPLPRVPPMAQLVSSIVPCQLLAYYLAVARELNPDRPRNLAKSVTVQ